MLDFKEQNSNLLTSPRAPVENTLLTTIFNHCPGGFVYVSRNIICAYFQTCSSQAFSTSIWHLYFVSGLEISIPLHIEDAFREYNCLTPSKDDVMITGDVGGLYHI